MEDKCGRCNPISPLLCLEDCSTWKVKKELNRISSVISKPNHALRLLNVVKNRRRLAILHILRERPLAIAELQKRLGSRGFRHSQRAIHQYVKPMLQVGLVQKRNNRFELTIYGRKIDDTAVRHRFSGQLPPRSNGYEEELLRSLLEGAKTRSALVNSVPTKCLSRILKRLREAKLISDTPSSAHVFYFRTKRALSLEKLTPTQKRICESIPEAGISAPELSRVTSVNLRKTYKCLRSLRGKKLLFRRNIPTRYELTSTGKAAAKFLEEVAHIA
jgi:DNA-binding HxlR family transcriptional regulator